MPAIITNFAKIVYCDSQGRLRNKPGFKGRTAHAYADYRIGKNGYRRVRMVVDGASVTMAAHRIVFYLLHGFLPPQVDHIDGDRLNNLPSNLRACTNQQNQWNREGRDGVALGVQKSPTPGKWIARIPTQNGRKHLGTFDSLELANLVCLEAREKYHGEFARAM